MNQRGALLVTNRPFGSRTGGRLYIGEALPSALVAIRNFAVLSWNAVNTESSKRSTSSFFTRNHVEAATSGLRALFKRMVSARS